MRKPMVVVIKSQMGAPIYAFSGNKVYWEVKEDLPRFTKLIIDNKALLSTGPTSRSLTRRCWIKNYRIGNEYIILQNAA